MTRMGVWMWPQSMMRNGAEKTAAHCARAGVTDIFFLTKGLSGAASYASHIAPAVCGRDLLQELLEAAHERGIRVHAWLTSTCDEHYKREHPQSGRCHLTRGRDRELISLTDDGYLAYMEAFTQELCRTHEIDGLHLDYIRYNHLLYGWAEEDAARYAAEGADVKHLRELMQRMFLQEPREENALFEAYRAGDESVLALARVRRRDVVRFASALTGAARAENSRLVLSAALMPEGAYDDLAFADLHYGQNYEDAAALYELVLPMAYSRAYGQDSQWVRRVAEGTLKRGLQTLVGLHAYEGGTGLSLRQDLDALCHTPVQGVCLFREGAMAMAYAEGKTLHVYNAMEEPITRVIVNGQEQTASLDADAAPGEEQHFALPFDVQTLRVFAGEKERSVYLSKG